MFAKKLTRWSAKSSARHRNEKIGKIKQKPSSSEEMVQGIVREGSPGGKNAVREKVCLVFATDRQTDTQTQTHDDG